MAKIYIASALANYQEVLAWQERFQKVGIQQTYDWAILYKRSQLPHIPEMVEGVKRADIFLLMLPGGRGAHVELGIAIGPAKPVVLCTNNDSKESIAFYQSPGIETVATMEDAFNKVIQILLEK